MPRRLSLLGHPYRPTGRGEHIRAIWRALNAVGLHASIYNLHMPVEEDPAFECFRAHTIKHVPGGVRIFHISGNEVEHTLRILDERQPGLFEAGYNIVFPAWELPKYPENWARGLEKFNEIWTASTFVEEAIRDAVCTPVIHIPNACEPHLNERFGRDYYSLPERSFLILSMFSLRSWHIRKNPLAAVEAFKGALSARPGADIHLVLKVNHSEEDPEFFARLRAAIEVLDGNVTLLTGTWTLDKTRSLVHCCDCLLSLHRSEGFGRAPAEAMFFGKPVVATGWSGNMEYMNAEVAFPISYKLVPVAEGEFLDWEGQIWAEPDVSDAVTVLTRIIDNPSYRAMELCRLLAEGWTMEEEEKPRSGSRQQEFWRSTRVRQQAHSAP